MRVQVIAMMMVRSQVRCGQDHQEADGEQWHGDHEEDGDSLLPLNEKAADSPSLCFSFFFHRGSVGEDKVLL